MTLVTCPDCGKEISSLADKCPQCARPMTPSNAEQNLIVAEVIQTLTAERVKKTEMAGIGCVLQGIGFVLLFLFPIGTVIGIILVVYGSQKSKFWTCGSCRNRITDKNVKICPTCHVEFVESH